MELSRLSPPKGSRKSRKRVGRGPGSGCGKTAGRGSKGQKSRSGGNTRPGFEGGQMPLQRRLPKRGFTNIFKKQYAIVNVRDLRRFEKDAVVDETALVGAGLVKGKRQGVKLLGHGNVDHALVVRVNRCSKSAQQGVEAAGGRVELI